MTAIRTLQALALVMGVYFLFSPLSPSYFWITENWNHWQRAGAIAVTWMLLGVFLYFDPTRTRQNQPQPAQQTPKPIKLKAIQLKKEVEKLGYGQVCFTRDDAGLCVAFLKSCGEDYGEARGLDWREALEGLAAQCYIRACRDMAWNVSTREGKVTARHGLFALEGQGESQLDKTRSLFEQVRGFSKSRPEAWL